MDSKNGLSYPFSIVISLDFVRQSLRVPTLLAAILAQQAGARLLAIHSGRISASIGSEQILIRVREANVYIDEAKAYELMGLPVPQRVLDDIERWECKHSV